MARIDQINSFCKVVELGSFSQAAEVLKLSQPTVSMQVKSLEEEFGAELLHREGHKIIPTEDGKLIYGHFIKISALYEKALQDLHKNKNNFCGNLVVGASSGPAEYPIPLILGKFKEEHPNALLTLLVGDSVEIIEKVAIQAIELGFVGAHRRDGNLIFEPFLEDPLVLVAARSHPAAQKDRINFEELRHIPLILQQPGSGATINLQEALARINLKTCDLNIRMELGLQDSVKSAVLAGYGATIISQLSVKNELAAGQMRRIDVDGLDLMRQIYICVNRNVPLSRLASSLLEFAKENKEI